MLRRIILSSSALAGIAALALTLPDRGDAQAGDPFAGSYEGTADGGTGVATITRGEPNRYQVEHTIATSSGCGGSVRGAATARGNVLELRIPVNPQTLCVITYRKTGEILAISEHSCGYFHGRSCAFDGRLTRKSRSGNRAAGSRTRTEEPLFGLMEGGGPAGGALVTPQRSQSVKHEWKFDGVAGAFAAAINSPAMIAIASCDDLERVTPIFTLGVANAERNPALKRLLSAGPILVAVTGPSGTHLFRSGADGDSGGVLIGNTPVTLAPAKEITRADLRALMAASKIRFAVAGQVFTLPVQGSAKAIGNLSCI